MKMIIGGVAVSIDKDDADMYIDFIMSGADDQAQLYEALMSMALSYIAEKNGMEPDKDGNLVLDTEKLSDELKEVAEFVSYLYNTYDKIFPIKLVQRLS